MFTSLPSVSYSVYTLLPSFQISRWNHWNHLRIHPQKSKVPIGNVQPQIKHSNQIIKRWSRSSEQSNYQRYKLALIRSVGMKDRKVRTIIISPLCVTLACYELTELTEPFTISPMTSIARINPIASSTSFGAS